MTLRILGAEAHDATPSAHTPANMRILLAESVKQIAREINFKSILYDCDCHARAAEQSNGTAFSFCTESMSAQNETADIKEIISDITATDKILTRLYHLCQSVIDNSSQNTDCAKEIKLLISELDFKNRRPLDPKVVNLFAADKNRKSYPEWSAEALQLDKIDLSNPDKVENSIKVISSAMSVLAYSKTRAEQMLANRQQIIRELSIARENIAASASSISLQNSCTETKDNKLLSFTPNQDAEHSFSEARRVLLGRCNE